MITGINTDIKYNGVVYHVQTEDKGPENPLLLSLVYVGGHILAAKRTNYARDLVEGISQDELQAKLDKQHKLILAIISRGRIDELVKMREREVQAEREAALQTSGGEPAAPEPPQPIFSPPPPAQEAPVWSVPSPVQAEPVAEVLPDITLPGAESLPAAPPLGTTQMLSPLLAEQLLSSFSSTPQPVIESTPSVGVSEELSALLGESSESAGKLPPPPPSMPQAPLGVTQVLSPLVAGLLSEPPVSAESSKGNTAASLDALLHQIISSGQVTTDLSVPDQNQMQPQPIRPGESGGRPETGSLSFGKTQAFREFDLDRIISDYLQTESKEEKVEVRLLGNTAFYAGETVVLQVEVTRGQTRAPLGAAPVIVKVLGTSFKPQTHSMMTGPDGMAMTTITLPNFTAGSAAIVVQTSSDAGEAEIKQLIRRR
ncbi:MAG: hypothetical protein HY774_16745 [Acidobacteria bacterium]|nr:hypothetical protein [Acidobacteriota bacterium]